MGGRAAGAPRGLWPDRNGRRRRGRWGGVGGCNGSKGTAATEGREGTGLGAPRAPPSHEARSGLLSTAQQVAGTGRRASGLCETSSPSERPGSGSRPPRVSPELRRGGEAGGGSSALGRPPPTSPKRSAQSPAPRRGAALGVEPESARRAAEAPPSEGQTTWRIRGSSF